jgi:hypothetical protein
MCKVSNVLILLFLLVFAASSAVSPAQHTTSLTQSSFADTKSDVFGKRLHTPGMGGKRLAEDSPAVTEPNSEFSSPLTETRTTFTSARQFVDGANVPAPSRAPPVVL